MFFLTKWKARALNWLQRLLVGLQKRGKKGRKQFLFSRFSRFSRQAARQAEKLEPAEKGSLFRAWSRELGGIFPRGYLPLAGAYILALVLLFAIFISRQGKIPLLFLPGKIENQTEFGLQVGETGHSQQAETDNEERAGKMGTDLGTGDGEMAGDAGLGIGGAGTGANAGIAGINVGTGKETEKKLTPTESGTRARADTPAPAGGATASGLAGSDGTSTGTEGSKKGTEGSKLGIEGTTEGATGTGLASGVGTPVGTSGGVSDDVPITDVHVPKGSGGLPTTGTNALIETDPPIGETSPGGASLPEPAPAPAPAPALAPGEIAAPLSPPASPLPTWQVYLPFGEYSSEKLPSGGMLHALTRGVNLMATPGAPVAALWDGRVSKIGGSNTPYNQFVILEHNGGYATFYGNLREIWVKEGSQVYRGEHLGLLPHFPPSETDTAMAVSAVATQPPGEAADAEKNGNRSNSDSGDGSGEVPLKTIHKGAPGEMQTLAWPFEKGSPLLYLEVRLGNSYLDPLSFIGVRN